MPECKDKNAARQGRSTAPEATSAAAPASASMPQVAPAPTCMPPPMPVPAPGATPAKNPSDPTPLTHRDYAAFARQPDARLLRDCEVSVFRATGPGGQGVNTTDSAVRMRHVPTGVAVVSRESRSQLQNRLTCLAKLRAIFERRSHPPKHRTPTKVSRAQKERRLQAKHHASQKKARRSAPSRDDW